MSSDPMKKTFKNLKLKDMDYFTGGAHVVEMIDDNILQTSRTHKCNCEQFEPHMSGGRLDFCDNCKHAQAPSHESEVTYCTMQAL